MSISKINLKTLKAMPRTCRMCKTPLSGRADKIFCSTACKNEYHLKLRRATAEVVRETDNILHRIKHYPISFPKKLSIINKAELPKQNIKTASL